jgi:hypothetical protein
MKHEDIVIFAHHNTSCNIPMPFDAVAIVIQMRRLSSFSIFSAPVKVDQLCTTVHDYDVGMP